MAVRFIDCDQNSPEWHAARLGIPTASSFKDLLAKAKNGTERKTRDTYLRKIAGEVIQGRPMETYSNDDMARGHAQEEEAAAHYAFLQRVTVSKIGFARDDDLRAGASPDRDVGGEGLLEIKTKAPHLMVELIANWDASCPSEHKAQCQGQLWVTGRPWVDLAFYCPGMPMPIVRVYRDEFFIAELAREVREFNADLDRLVDQVMAFGRPAPALAA
ncbi:lambda exonuclease family protein [Caulobacter segnis]|uniref:Exonuclease n=1 Tax=Caulobacter segnis TaxID=88688 RepID=A0A2W5VM57_9CAUL|nr:lambda exonuclease family protein [Caulobacter segnis]PZR36455.1 MAG: exonuclease [Caulobacter segnis]